MKAIALSFLGFLMINGCAHEKTESDFTVANISTTTQSQSNFPDIYSDGLSKQIKHAHYRFQVKDVKRSTETIEVVISKYPAYIAASKMTLENPILENKITIKVQNQYFQNLLKEIDKEPVFVNFRDVSTEDVSKQFVDLESRLKSKREVEQRLMHILRNKAGNVKEVLEAEKQIGDLHEEIEAVVSRINFLKDEVSYSTIELEFYQTVTEVIADAENTFGSKLLTALLGGLKGLTAVVIGLLYVWPLLLLTAAIVVWLKKNKLFLRSTQPRS
jgi:hypothetical protein